MLSDTHSFHCNHDTSGNFLVETYLKLSYKAKMKTLSKVDNYTVSMLPGQTNLAQKLTPSK